MKARLIVALVLATGIGVALGSSLTLWVATLLGAVCGGGIGYAIDQLLES